MKKRLLTLMVVLLLGFAPFAQTRAAFFASSPQQHLKKDGTPDKRYKENKHLTKSGKADMRYKSNNPNAGGKKKK